MAARSKAWVCSRLRAGIVGSNPTGSMDVCLLGVVCYQVEVSETIRLLVQRSRTECGVSECDHVASTIRRSSPTGICDAMGGKMQRIHFNVKPTLSARSSDDV
jgi:hypothetical protein